MASMDLVLLGLLLTCCITVTTPYRYSISFHPTLPTNTNDSFLISFVCQGIIVPALKRMNRIKTGEAVQPLVDEALSGALREVRIKFGVCIVSFSFCIFIISMVEY